MDDAIDWAMDGAIDWAIRAGDVVAVLEHAERTAGVAARRHALDRLERALVLADPSTELHRALERAAALGVSRPVLEACRGELPPHAVRVPLVLRTDRGPPRALVRAVMVAYEASDAPSTAWSLTPPTARAVTAAIRLAAREASPASPVERFQLVPVQPGALDGVEITGPSLAAAAYVSALALFSGRRARASLAVTGALAGRALARIDGLAEKADAAARLGLAGLVVPRANDERAEGLELLRAADVDELAALTLERGRADVDLDAEVRAATRATESGWNGYRWPAVREVVARALARVPERRPELRIELLARLAATERHLGRTEASLACLAEADAIARSPIAKIAVPDEQLVRLARQHAMTSLRALRMGEARRAAGRSVSIARRARLRGELILSLGAEGLCALARGAPLEAVSVFEEALAHTLAHRPSNAARSRAYLVEALGRAGRARAAREQYVLALREADDDASRGIDGKVAWVRTSWASALLALGRDAEVVRVLSHASVERAIAETPLPGLKARRVLGLALVRRPRTRGRREEGLALLEGSPFAYDGLEPALRAMAHANLLHGLRTRAAAGAAPDRATLAASLAGLPQVARLRPLVRAVERAAQEPHALARALDALLVVVEPL
jgi:hypothetical protein